MNANEEGGEDDGDNMGDELDDNESEGDSGWCTLDHHTLQPQHLFSLSF